MKGRTIYLNHVQKEWERNNRADREEWGKILQNRGLIKMERVRTKSKGKITIQKRGGNLKLAVGYGNVEDNFDR